MNLTATNLMWHPRYTQRSGSFRQRQRPEYYTTTFKHLNNSLLIIRTYSCKNKNSCRKPAF
jgi:hypothetical protein